MKTAEEWQYEWYYSENPSRTTHIKFIEAIQRDALSNPMANTTDQKKLKEAEWTIERERMRVDLIRYELQSMKAESQRMKTKWHEARKHLRAANKGAERNNMVMRLQAADISRLLEKIKQLEQTTKQQ